MDELLNETMFRSPVHARAVTADWVIDYNTQRPHSIRRENDPPDRFLILLKLGYQTPADFALHLGRVAFNRNPNSPQEPGEF